MSKNRVRVWPGIVGGWLVVVVVGNDELLSAVRRTGTVDTVYGNHDTAVRAARRIGKALGLPVEVE